MFGGTFHHASCFKCESCENSLADRQVVVSEGMSDVSTVFAHLRIQMVQKHAPPKNIIIYA